MYIENLKHITICYYNQVESVKLMVQEHYDIPEYDNTLFILNAFGIGLEPEQYGNLTKGHNRVIYYNLEHRCAKGVYKTWYNDDMRYLTGLVKLGITELWSMDYESEFALMARDTFNIPIKFKPVRYTSLIQKVPNIYSTNKNIDCCHIGIISSQHRIDLIREIENNQQNISFKFITSTTNMTQCIPEMNNSKFIIDTLRLNGMLSPNQVRIFELLCMGYSVCNEKCPINMFPGLTYEWQNINDLYEIVKNKDYIYPTENYKEMTYTDEAYEKYVNNLIEQWNTLD